VAARPSGECRIDGLNQMSYAVSLRQHKINAHGGYRALGNILGVHGEHDDRDARYGLLQNRSGLDTIHVGHGQVQKDYVGFQFLGLFDRFHAVNCFAADLDFRSVFQERLHEITHINVVIDNQNTFHHATNYLLLSLEENTVNSVDSNMTHVGRVLRGVPLNRRAEPVRWIFRPGATNTEP